MTYQFSESDRWTGAIEEGEMTPKGSKQCFRQALERLGPFKHKTQAEAERLGPWNEMGLTVSMELAAERVIGLAFDYNRHTEQNAHAPRIKDVVERITKLELLAGELARYIEGLDDMSRFYLHTGGTGLNDYPAPYINPIMEDADYSRLPRPEQGRTEGDWVSKLDSLSRYATFCLKNFLECKGIDSIDRADVGGNTNLLKEIAGSPEWGLVHGGWYLYDLFKPDTATATDGGPFHLFLMNVFEFATGKDPVESSLVPMIKRIVVVQRRFKEIVKRENVLRRELDDLEDEDFQYRNPDRAAEIQSELLLLAGHRMLLAPSLEPPKARKRRGNEPRAKA